MLHYIVYIFFAMLHFLKCFVLLEQGHGGERG
jgi:hypothetical protein